MNLKSYFAATVESAMASAVKELGSEAMLVYSRETAEDARNLGRYEVVFGWETVVGREPDSRNEKNEELGPIPVDSARQEGNQKVTIKRPGTRDRKTSSGKSDPEKEGGRVGRLARFASPDAKTVARSLNVPPQTKVMEEPNFSIICEDEAGGLAGTGKALELRGSRRALSERIESVLLNEGFSKDLSVWAAGRLAQESDLVSPKPAFWAGLAGRIPLASQEEEGKSAAVVVGGPAGVGKTACLEKLIFRLGLARGREVHLVSTDSLRICGGQRLERFAELVGARHSLASGAEALEKIIRSEPPGSLLLIEAGGWLSEGGAVWTALRKRNPVVQLHLMLPVALRPEDLDRQFRRFAPLSPDFLVLARADESDQNGALCSLAAERRVALSYLQSAGSRPESIEAATLPRLLAPILNKAAGKEGRLAPTDNLSV